jgi:mono/diheme cytochrome c family protein
MPLCFPLESPPQTSEVCATGERERLSGMQAARIVQAIGILVVCLALGIGLAACGGDDDGSATTATETTTDETTTDDGTTPVGREVFVANCGSCHTLSDAGTSGAIGPSLDGAGYSEDQVAEQVREGGGGMPAFEDTLSDEEITEVAAYVAAASSG